MADVARAIEQAASCSVDEKLWWESHESLFYELDKLASSSPQVPPNGLAQKMRDNHSWLLDMVLRFKSPSQSSRTALDVGRVVLGGQSLEINAELKNIALQLSPKLVLDEVQTYIIASKFFSGKAPFFDQNLLQKIALKYYMERQCLLKSTRLILLLHMSEPSRTFAFEPIDNEAKELVQDGLENKVFAVLQKLLTITQPLDLDSNLSNLWAEEIVMEQNLVMDILFLLYYEPLCSCSFARWKELFVLFQGELFSGRTMGRLPLSGEALGLAQHVKHQAILITLEALDLDKLLLMVFDEVTFSVGGHPFSVEELRQVDQLFAGLNPSEPQEYAPLLLAWATFCCLVSIIPVSDQETQVLDLDHTSYMHQAYEGGALKYLLEMLHHHGIQECDIDGYKCVIKSLVSSFIAAYDIASQSDSAVLDTLVDIFYAIYKGQEILCIEFWDRESVLDGPIRNLLFSLCEYFPYQFKPLIQLLAGLSEGAWPAECTYDFLYRMLKITCLYHTDAHVALESDVQVIRTTVPLQVPGAPGLLIPAGSNGLVIRVIDEHTTLVRWECKHSAIVVLLFRLMGACTLDNSWSDVYASLNLMSHMLLSNKMLAELLLELDNSVACTGARDDGRMEKTARINVLDVICILLDKLLDGAGDISAVSLCMEILGVFAACCPTKVMSELSRTTLLQPTRGMVYCLDGSLIAKSFSRIFRNPEQSEGMRTVVIGVIDLCTILIEKGIQSENWITIVPYVVSNLFVNQMTWKYNQKYECWKMSTKVFQLACTVLSHSHPRFSQLRAEVLEIIVADHHVHDVILKILSTSAPHLEELYFTYGVDVKEIEWFEKALDSGMKLLDQVLSDIITSVSKDSTGITELEHALLHHATGAISFVGAITSLIGFPQNQCLQLASTKMLITLCHVAQRGRPHRVSISSYIRGFEQRQSLRKVLGNLLSKEMAFSSIQLFNAAVELLTTAVRYQPSLIDLLFSPIKTINESSVDTVQGLSKGVPLPKIRKQITTHDADGEPLEAVWQILNQGQSLFKSHPDVLSGVLFVLKSLWEEGMEFAAILEGLRHREGFWNVLTVCDMNVPSDSIIRTEEMRTKSFQYQCETWALQIMACDTFLQQYISCNEGSSLMTQIGDARVVHVNSEIRNGIDELPLVQWINSVHPSNIITSFARSHYDKTVFLKAKAEMRALLVALMLKILAEDKLGLSALLIEFIQESLKAVLDHPAFHELLSSYLSHGYGYGKELQVLVLSDLYFHLQGELEAGRHIPDGSFQQLVEFLDTMDITLLLQPSKQMPSEGLHPPLHDGFIFDTTQLGQHLGLEWWSHTEPHILLAAESALCAMHRANEMARLGCSQLSALKSLTNLLALSSPKKQVVGAGFTSLKGIMLDSCILELCTALESSVEVLSPAGGSTHYMPSFLVTQSQLLLVLVHWFSSCMADHVLKAEAGLVYAKVVKTIAGCMRPIMGSLSAIQAVQKVLVRSLLSAFLMCLELMQMHNGGEKLYEETKSTCQRQNNEDAFLEIALISMEFLPVLCSFVETKDYINLAVAAISILIKHFLAPQTWLPILNVHFPIRSALSSIQMADSTATAYQVLSFFLSLSLVKGGAEILQSAGIFAHIMLFSEQLKEEVSFVSGEMEGPFCVWTRRAKRNELWGLCVAIVASAVRCLGEKDGGVAVENALVFFESQKEQMLCALQSPRFADADGKKKARLPRPQTSISALQETQQVLHLMVELVGHHVQWSHTLGRSAIQFREMCIHLLAYIAREGLIRNMSSGVVTCVLCPPMKNEEVLAHSNPSILGCRTGWFAVAAKGALSIKRSSNLATNTRQPNGVSSQAKVRPVQTEDVVPTQYSDSVALQVYRIALLLLEFLCKHVQQALKAPDGGTVNSANFPELPAPEILYGLQDQVMYVITEVCSRRSSTLVEEETRQVCRILFSILEKALFLEVCVLRVCGIGPLSLRSEDFSKEYKALLSAIQGHQFLDAPLRALNIVLELAHPALL